MMKTKQEIAMATTCRLASVIYAALDDDRERMPMEQTAPDTHVKKNPPHSEQRAIKSLTFTAYRRHNYSRAVSTLVKACQCLEHGFFHGFCIPDNCKARSAIFAGHGRNAIPARGICPPFTSGLRCPAFFASFGHETETVKIL